MNLYVPLGSLPAIGRIRLYEIGGLTDVKEAGEHVLLHDSSPVRTEGRDHGSRLPSRPFVTSQHHVEVLAGALSLMLKCCGVG